MGTGEASSWATVKECSLTLSAGTAEVSCFRFSNGYSDLVTDDRLRHNFIHYARLIIREVDSCLKPRVLFA